jgi:hypothetical protein
MTLAGPLYFFSFASVKLRKHHRVVTQGGLYGRLEPRICSHGRLLRYRLIAMHTDTQYLYPMISVSRTQPLHTSLRFVTMICSKINTSCDEWKEICFDRRLHRCTKFPFGWTGVDLRAEDPVKPCCFCRSPKSLNLRPAHFRSLA